MKKSGLMLGLWLATWGQLSAQVTVDLALDESEFLPGETIPLAVRITNRSGQTLTLGQTQDWLTFSVESKDHYVVLKTEDVPVVGEFTLDSSMRAIKKVDLQPYYNLLKPGRYTVTATVTIRDWSRQITTSAKAFNIIQGVHLWEKEFGVPRVEGPSNAPPEVRKYALQQANYLKRHLMLYFRLTDRTGKLNKVYALGPMLSFGQPEAQVDRLSNLHVLYQNGPHSFNYNIIDPNGDVIRRQTYAYTTRPRLQADEAGSVVITGGTRQPKADDLPAATNVQAMTP